MLKIIKCNVEIHTFFIILGIYIIVFAVI